MTSPVSRLSLYEALRSPERPQPDAPYTAWPDPDVGFRILDLRSMAWADGPFSTPAEAVEAMDRLNQRAVAEAEAAAGPVLVVDDDNSIVDMLILALGCRGYQVLSAEGASALQLAAEHHPAVVLLDLTMPGMGGAEIGRRLRDDPRTADIPIVMMSARDHLDSAWATVPADDHLAKPFNLSRLYETVARWAGPA